MATATSGISIGRAAAVGCASAAAKMTEANRISAKIENRYSTGLARKKVGQGGAPSS